MPGKASAFSAQLFGRDGGGSFADPYFLFVLDTTIGLSHGFLPACSVELFGVILDTTISSD